MDGIDLMASAMRAAKTRLDVAATNLANVSTGGFHKRLTHARLDARGMTLRTSDDATAGSLKHTGRAFDLAIAGPGSLTVRDASGTERTVRSASFERDARGRLVDDRGGALLGAHGPLVVSADATIDAQGNVVDRDRVAGGVKLPANATLESGFLEGSNVDPIGEMVDVLGAQRAFETAQKALTAIDETRQKNASDVARIAS